MIFLLILVATLFVPESILKVNSPWWMFRMMWAELIFEGLFWIAFFTTTHFNK